jgi:hypothetical protein
VDPSSPGAAAEWQQIEQDNRKVKAAVGSSLATLMSKGVKFMAFEPNSQADVEGNVIVAVEPAPGVQDSDIAQGADQLASQAAKIGATQFTTRIVSLDGHQALQLSYTLTVKDVLGNNHTAPGIQYYVGANDFVYSITLTGTSADLSTIVANFHSQ